MGAGDFIDHANPLCYPSSAVAKDIAKDLKRPDQFVDFWTRTSHRIGAFIAPRRKPALAALVALIVVLIGGTLIDRWDTSRRESASHAFARIEAIAIADLLPASGTPPPGETSDVPRFKTAEERRSAVLKELDGFLSAHGRSKLRDEALMMKGKELFVAGRHDESLAAYEAALAAKVPARLAFLAHEGIGYAHEGKGQLDQALAAFGRMADTASSFQGFSRDRALYHRARITERKGDKAAALKLYNEALQANPDGSLRDEIADRVALLDQPAGAVAGSAPQAAPADPRSHPAQGAAGAPDLPAKDATRPPPDVRPREAK